ncbi:MAG TPA: lipocalin family protein [Flavobacterium sp.]|nr:lipocalin family protein [Flavobacterium sp.]
MKKIGVCLLFLAGMQIVQAQNEDYSDYPLFMESFWKKDNLNAKMVTSQLLATKSGKQLITAYEKGLAAINDYNNGKVKQPDYAQKEQYEEAVKTLKIFLADEGLAYTNEETQLLMEYYSQLLVFANSWKRESVHEIENDFTYGKMQFDRCAFDTKLEFSSNGSFEGTKCYTYNNECECDDFSGRWHLTGARLYLEFDNGQEDFYLIWFMDDKLYLADEYFDYLQEFSR